MDLGLSGKVAIVAAASAGLGKACARGLSIEGARVAICARSEAKLVETADAITRETGGEVLPVQADVCSPVDIHRLVERTVERWGGVDILVTNAGGPKPGPFTQITDADWQAAFDLDLLSVVRLIREALPYMRQRRWGRIVNIQSATVRQPADNFVLSNSIRPGVAGLTRSLVSEISREGITVNTVCPGRILTDELQRVQAYRAKSMNVPPEVIMEKYVESIPMGRLGTPEEVADVVVFLASGQASYLTGVALQIDGGLVRGLI